MYCYVVDQTIYALTIVKLASNWVSVVAWDASIYGINNTSSSENIKKVNKK